MNIVKKELSFLPISKEYSCPDDIYRDVIFYLSIFLQGNFNIAGFARFSPLIIGFVAFSAFGTEAWDLVTGNRTWSAFDDIQNSYMLFLASSMVAGVVSLLDRR